MSIEKNSLDEWLRENDLTPETRLYRYTLAEHLRPTDESTVFEITANPDPSEAVVDVHGQGHITLAVHVGPGLAFSMTPENEWQSDERRCVELRLGDALEAGGSVYPVESVTTDRAWYVTMPRGSVRVRVGD